MIRRDQFDYSAELLYRHVDCIWEQDYVLKARDQSEIKSRSDPGHQPDLPAIVADIRRAWERCGLDGTERQIFTLRAFWQLSLSPIAEVYDITEQQVADVLDAATAQILNTLNGKVRTNA